VLFTPDERRAILAIAGLLLMGLAARWIAPGPPPPPGGGDSLLAILAAPAAPDTARRGRIPAPGLAEEGRVRINLGSAEDLTALPRIGPVLARRIVEERARGGPFRDIQDLRRVRGIGPALSARIAPHVSFSLGGAGAPADCTAVLHDARSAPERREAIRRN
jgi:competence protein ComEA